MRSPNAEKTKIVLLKSPYTLKLQNITTSSPQKWVVSQGFSMTANVSKASSSFSALTDPLSMADGVREYA